MSEDEINKLKGESSKSKWYSIITAVIVLVKTIIDILMN